jgi:nitrous oxidase accessory protein NosD
MKEIQEVTRKTGSNVKSKDLTPFAFVSSAINNFDVSNTTIHDSLVGVFWVDGHTGASMYNNKFANNTTDIQCSIADAGITGSGNVKSSGDKPSCVTCGNCPF